VSARGVRTSTHACPSTTTCPAIDTASVQSGSIANSRVATVHMCVVTAPSIRTVTSVWPHSTVAGVATLRIPPSGSAWREISLVGVCQTSLGNLQYLRLRESKSPIFCNK